MSSQPSDLITAKIAFERAVRPHAERRKLLYGWVRKTGWAWRDVEEAQPRTEERWRLK